MDPSKYRSGAALQIQTTLAIFSAFVLTLITTLLILYRIIVVTRRTNLPKQRRNTYQDIVDMIIQSSALYSVVLLIWAISWVITPSPALLGPPRQIPLNDMSKFMEEISFLAAVCRAYLFYKKLEH